MDNRDNIGLLESVYNNLQRFKSNSFFFNYCQKLGCLPKGIQLNFNLALGVNEPALVTEIEFILEKASSNILDCLNKYCEEKEEEMEEEFERLKVEVEVRELAGMKRKVNRETNKERQRLKGKLKSLERQNPPSVRIMEQCRGSRRITARHYRSGGGAEGRVAPGGLPRLGLRRHRRERRSRLEQQQRRRMRRNEKRREERMRLREGDLRMVEEEREKRNPVNESSVELTPAQVEVTRLAAKFVPMDRRPVDTGDIMRGFENFANNLRWAWFHDQRRRRRVEGEEEGSEGEEEEPFIMSPWYQRSRRQRRRVIPSWRPAWTGSEDSSWTRPARGG